MASQGKRSWPMEAQPRQSKTPRPTKHCSQVGQLHTKEAALEKNIERLYSAAKRKIAQQDEEIGMSKRQRSDAAPK